MAYSSTTDFLALLRQTSGGVRTERMPGLDYVVAAMARAGLFSLSIGQTAPTVNQSTTVWLPPSVPSWVAEGAVWLWSTAAAQYVPATPALWIAFLAGVSKYSFQSVVGAVGVINGGTSILAVQRAAPAATALQLPSVASQGNGNVLNISDWSTGVVNHVMTLTAFGSNTIMGQASWQLLSSAAQLSFISLYPSTDLNGWAIVS